MVPVIDAIAAASRIAISKAILRIRSTALERFLESEFAFSETAEKLLFNIGRIAVRQSRSFAGVRRQILPPGRKSGRRCGSPDFPCQRKALKLIYILLEIWVARSLLIKVPVPSRKAARGQRHVRSSSKRVCSDRAGETREARCLPGKRKFRGVGK